MRKTHYYIFAIFIFLYGSKIAEAQQITPIVINNSGGTQTGTAGILNFNVGECAVSTVGNGSYTVTQGFLQPLTQNTLSVKNIVKTANEWAVHPNPASDFLIINPGNYKDPFWIKVIDNMGKEVLFAEVMNNRISLSGINPGIYMLLILSNQKEIIVSKTITKIN